MSGFWSALRYLDCHWPTFYLILLESLRVIGRGFPDSVLIPSLSAGVTTGVLSPLEPSGRWSPSKAGPLIPRRRIVPFGVHDGGQFVTQTKWDVQGEYLASMDVHFIRPRLVLRWDLVGGIFSSSAFIWSLDFYPQRRGSAFIPLSHDSPYQLCLHRKILLHRCIFLLGCHQSCTVCC